MAADANLDVVGVAKYLLVVVRLRGVTVHAYSSKREFVASVISRTSCAMFFTAMAMNNTQMAFATASQFKNGTSSSVDILACEGPIGSGGVSEESFSSSGSRRLIYSLILPKRERGHDPPKRCVWV